MIDLEKNVYAVHETDKGKVKELNIDVLRYIDEKFFSEGWTDQASVAFGVWCLTGGVHYYAAPKEDFRLYDALLEAIENGCDYLIAENLS